MKLGKRISQTLTFYLATIMVCLAVSTANSLAAQETSAVEERIVNYSAPYTMETVKAVLRGEGILFEQPSSNEIVTLWTQANASPTFFQSLLGRWPRYRYKITVVPNGLNKSTIEVALETENLSPQDAQAYKASTFLNLFNKFDKLASEFPPPSTTPKTGGVNFTVLPNEDLKALAKRATGDENNWRQIAEDNGLKSPSDVKPFQVIWVRSSLIKNTP